MIIIIECRSIPLKLYIFLYKLINIYKYNEYMKINKRWLLGYAR